MIVQDLFQGLTLSTSFPISERTVSGIALDSREVESGDLFVALQGQKLDGEKFIQDALSKGAVGVLSEKELPKFRENALVVPELRKHLGELASRVYGQPSLALTAIGITGTNGKTTVTYLLESILKRAGHRPGVVGTVNYRWGNRQESALHTTPEAPRLQKTLRKMVDDQVSHAMVECSSHALSYDRISSLHLDVAVFTNLTQDHLDFHGSLEAYAEAKRKLFDDVLMKSQKERKRAVINVDDPVGCAWAEDLPFSVLTYSLENPKASIFAEKTEVSVHGISAKVHTPQGDFHLRSSLIGEHNLSNLLGAIAVAVGLEIPTEIIAEALNQRIEIPGRLEAVSENANVFVDYAHTEDALRNVLNTLKPLTKDRLIVVFGCGGDRDKGKRPKMMRAAWEQADVVIVTSDNPRTEDPQGILDDILSEKVGEVEDSKLLRRVLSREEAIGKAIRMASENDVVLIAGKGHETYQEVNGIRYDFDDREVARRFLKEKSL